MDLSFFPLTLEAIDRAAAESLCLFIGSDERPLTGLAGLCDWRLSGRLSRLLRSGLLSGSAGEAVLTPAGARLGFQKLFLFGVGASDQSEEALVQRVAEALHKLANAGVREAAMQLPARLAPEVGVRTLIDELQRPAKAMLFAADPQRLVNALSQAARSVPPAARTPTSPEMKPVPVETPPEAPQVVPEPDPVSEVPKAAPLPSAPLELPDAATLSEIPKAAPLPVAPIEAPDAAPPPAAPPDVPVAPVAEPTPAPPVNPAARPSPPPAGPQLRPAPPPPQRYVPPPPKPHVFERKKKK